MDRGSWHCTGDRDQDHLHVFLINHSCRRNKQFATVIVLERKQYMSSAIAAAAKSLQSCPTLRPHRWQPTRLPRPWDSPGKNTGVGCHFLQGVMTQRQSQLWRTSICFHQILTFSGKAGMHIWTWDCFLKIPLAKVKWPFYSMPDVVQNALHALHYSHYFSPNLNFSYL